MADSVNSNRTEARKILITGGAGFIGSNIVDGYIARGFEVVVVDNLSAGKKENLNPSARFYREDIRSEKIREIILDERPHIVNHHAAQISVPRSVEDPLMDADINIMGFINILEASKEVGVEKVIFASSGGAIYGEAAVLPTPEEQPPNLLFPYAVSKATGEAYLEYYKHHYGIDCIVLRYANIYGQRQTPEGEAGVVAIFMDNILNGRQSIIYAYDDQPQGMLRDYCHVEDVVRANILAAEKKTTGVFNIATGKAITTLELYNTILKAVEERDLPVDEAIRKPLFEKPRPGELKRSCLDAKRAESVLGWTPRIGLKEGIEKTLEWWLTQRVG